MKTINNIFQKKNFRAFKNLGAYFVEDKKARLGLIVFSLFMLIYITSKISESNHVVYRGNQNADFSQGRIFGTQTSSYLKSKEVMLNKTARKILADNNALREKIRLIEERMEAKS